MSALPSEKRKVLDEAEIIDAGLKGIGGNCLTQNGFLYMLLKVLGFNSYLVSGFVHGSRNRQDNHVVCVVEFSLDEKYLMDLGVGLPFAEPVPLNELPYTQMAAGFRYRYIKGDKGIYYRMQLDGALFGGEFVRKYDLYNVIYIITLAYILPVSTHLLQDDLNAEYVRYEFTLEPKPLDLFQRILAFIFNNVERSHFLQCPLLFRYFEEDGTGSLVDSPNTGDDRKWIMIRGVSVLIGTNTSRDITLVMMKLSMSY